MVQSTFSSFPYPKCCRLISATSRMNFFRKTLGNAKNWTRSCWVRSANATSVLCHPHHESWFDKSWESNSLPLHEGIWRTAVVIWMRMNTLPLPIQGGAFRPFWVKGQDKEKEKRKGFKMVDWWVAECNILQKKKNLNSNVLERIERLFFYCCVIEKRT